MLYYVLVLALVAGLLFVVKGKPPGTCRTHRIQRKAGRQRDSGRYRCTGRHDGTTYSRTYGNTN